MHHCKRRSWRIVFDCWKEFLISVDHGCTTDDFRVQLCTRATERNKGNKRPRKLQPCIRKGGAMGIARSEMREWNLSYKDSKTMRERMREFLEKKGQKHTGGKEMNRGFGKKKA